MFDTRKFGAFISRLRKNADMTQSELSDRLNLTRQAVSKYERGDSFPDISVLRLLSEIFGVSTGLLIASGEPTEGEAEILDGVLSGREVRPGNAADVVNLAPFLKPSVLSKLSESMSKNGIDMSGVMSLAEYLNDTDSQKLLKSVSFDNIAEMDIALLEKLLPLLGPFASEVIFEKMLSGELDFHYLECINIDETLVEQAVLLGVLDDEALNIMYRQNMNRYIIKDGARAPKIFTCPKCGLPLEFLYPTRCKCGYKVPAKGYTLNFSEGADFNGNCYDVDPKWLAQKFGKDITIFAPGAANAVWAAKFINEHQVYVIVADGDNARLEAADAATKNLNCGQLIFIATDYNHLNITDGVIDIALAGSCISDKELKRILKQGGCVIDGNKILWEKE
jgi:Predicted transcriptional regulators